MFARSIIAVNIIFLAAFSAHAQGTRTPYGVKPGRGNAQQVPMEKLNISGTIEAIAVGRIQVTDSSNEKWMIGLTPKTKIQVVGEAGVEFLHPGLFVQFKTELDKRLAAANPIDELTIVTPSQEKLPGVFPIGENKSDEGRNKTPAAGPCNVVGRITALKNNKLQINVGNGTVLCELSDNAKIRLDVADYTMVRKGDKINVAGLKIIGVPGQIQALQVKIDLAETLAGMAMKPPPAKTKVQNRSKLAKP